MTTSITTRWMVREQTVPELTAVIHGRDPSATLRVRDLILRRTDHGDEDAPSTTSRLLPELDGAVDNPVVWGLVGEWTMVFTPSRWTALIAAPHRQASFAVVDPRLDEASAMLAAARAALAELVEHGARRTLDQRPLIEHGTVRVDTAIGVAAAYALSVFARRVRETEAAHHNRATLAALVAAVAGESAHQSIHRCAHHLGIYTAGTPGRFRDWLGIVGGGHTTDGPASETVFIPDAIGELGLPEITLPGIPLEVDDVGSQPWWLQQLRYREATLARMLGSGRVDRADRSRGPDGLAVDLTVATAERLAATALHASALETDDTTARRLLESMTSAYALDRIQARAAWYLAHRRYAHPASTATQIELPRHRAILAEHLPPLIAAFAITPDTPSISQVDAATGHGPAHAG
ncbi:acyl-CoA dehydrogenase family protein [Nocardia takedensis]